MPQMPRAQPIFPLWPTLLGVNLWLIALLVPLLLGRAAASGVVWAVTPLAPLALVGGLGLRRHRAAQIVLIVGVPLLVLLPTAEGALAAAKLHPPVAVTMQLLVLVGYLAVVCADLARGSRSAFSEPPSRDQDQEPDQAQTSDGGTAAFSSGPGPAAEPLAGWHSVARVPAATSPRLRRRLTLYRLLLFMCVAVPALFLYAINWHPDNVRELRAALGSPGRAAAMQATLTAGATMLWSVLFHFFFMVPMDAHLDHDRGLRSRLATLRAASRRGRPRLNLYLAILVALASMGLLIWWSL
ncbi:MAG TPA: hypothetical protein PLW65_11920 [Pseudomonadota bacterium]|nr:hypothetical protein [Pseudomonadota bacterium]